MSRHSTSIVLLVIFCVSVSTSQTYTLDSAFIRSDSCVQIEWIPDSINTDPAWYITNGIKCTGVDSMYRHCDFLPGTAYMGIAYSYGGEDPYLLFRERLLQGFLVGSHLCHYSFYGDPSNRIAGTDCSGFLSYLWNYPRVSTVSFANSSDFKAIRFDELQPGDALVKSGSHIVFVLEADTITEVVISEASSTARGCRERLANLTDPEWNSYKAIRYPLLSRTAFRPGAIRISTGDLSVKMNVSGSYELEFARPFSGRVKLITLSGRVLYEKVVLAKKSISFSGLNNQVIIVNQYPEHEVPKSSKILVPCFK